MFCCNAEVPIALWSGSPDSLSHTTVVSLWFVIPTAENRITIKKENC